MKNRVIFYIIAALFLFPSASIWEGSAATAADGYLPGRGLYAATNSFPRNTVIEITNLENNKSIRVIVAEGLDSSGLLALISQDAADRIGMKRGSISRIRMTQPSDPIAYIRFIDGLAAGFPDYDSGAVFNEEKFRQENPLPAQASAAAGKRSGEPAVTGSTVPPMFLEDEWIGFPKVVNLPEHNVREETSNNDSLVTDAKPVIESIPYIAAPPPEPEQKPVPEQITETKNAPTPHEVDMDLEYVITAAEERPPEAPKIYNIDTEYIIPGINRPKPNEIPEPVKINNIDPEYMIPEISRHNLNEIPEPVKTNNIDPEYIIPGISRPSFAEIPVKPNEAPAPSSTIRQISQLDSGSYYVQIASLRGQELVESALGLIDSSYQPVVFKDGGAWYRILLGPLNQGESGAILRRFKSIGYKDSFIRQGK